MLRVIWLFAIYLTFRKRARPPQTHRGVIQAEGPGHAAD